MLFAYTDFEVAMGIVNGSLFAYIAWRHFLVFSRHAPDKPYQQTREEALGTRALVLVRGSTEEEVSRGRMAIVLLQFEERSQNDPPFVILGQASPDAIKYYNAI